MKHYVYMFIYLFVFTIDETYMHWSRLDVGLDLMIYHGSGLSDIIMMQNNVCIILFQWLIFPPQRFAICLVELYKAYYYAFANRSGVSLGVELFHVPLWSWKVKVKVRGSSSRLHNKIACNAPKSYLDASNDQNWHFKVMILT